MADTEQRPVIQSLPHWHMSGGDPPTVIDGEGARVSDDAGNTYLDFLSQLYCVNAGHGEQRIVKAMAEQAARIPYVSPAKHNDARADLAWALADRAPGDLSSVFFSVTGSEANEAAIHLARTYQDAPKILTRWRSYHGATYGAGSLTGDPETRAPVERFAATTGAAKFLPPLPRAFDGATGEELARRAADHLEFVIRNEGPDSIAALLTEPVGGTSGAYPAPPGYFERIRDLCDEYDILLVSDEVITGFGRCGEWFGIQTEGIEPDLITFAKGVTSAYAPLGGVIARPDLAEHFHESGIDIGQTFAGHPVSCAAGTAAVEVYTNGLLENVRDLASYLEGRLRELEAFDAVGAVHGRGFHWAVEFHDTDGDLLFDSRVEDGENPVATVRDVAQEEGVLFGGGRPDSQVIVSPPFCIERADIDTAVDALRIGIETAL